MGSSITPETGLKFLRGRGEGGNNNSDWLFTQPWGWAKAVKLSPSDAFFWFEITNTEAHHRVTHKNLKFSKAECLYSLILAKIVGFFRSFLPVDGLLVVFSLAFCGFRNMVFWKPWKSCEKNLLKTMNCHKSTKKLQKSNFSQKSTVNGS